MTGAFFIGDSLRAIDCPPYPDAGDDATLHARFRCAQVAPIPIQTGRRRFLKLGLIATATVAVIDGVLVWVERPFTKVGTLSASGRQIFRAVAATVLDGSLPADGREREAQLDQHLQRLDIVLNALPAPTQREIGQLLSLMGNPITRYPLTTLVPAWPDATPAEASQALDAMRRSTNTLRQQAYHAIRDLTNAAFYADPTSWPLMGYPGPTTL